MFEPLCSSLNFLQPREFNMLRYLNHLILTYLKPLSFPGDGVDEVSSDSNIRVGRELGAPNISCHTDSASCAKSLSDLAEVLVRKCLHVTLDLRSSGDTGIRVDGGHISCHVRVLHH